MGQSESKSRNKRLPPPPTSQTTARLYPDLPNEFPTYSHTNPVEYRPSPNTQVCFGNPIPHLNGPSYPYNPSAPSVAIGAEAYGQSFDTLTGRATLQAEAGNPSHLGNDNQERKPCPNARIGCKLHYNAEDMKQHLKECLFQNIRCPLNGVAGKCFWTDKVNSITTHFEDNHPENVGHVNQEHTITSLRTIHLVELKPFKFLVHIKVDEAEKKTLVAVQHYGTKFCASKWTFEFDFEGPHLEKTLTGTCISAGVSVEEKFKKLQCRVIPMTICLMDGFKRGGLKYKYRIMKKDNLGVMKKNEAKDDVSSKNMSKDVTKLAVAVARKLETTKKDKVKETKSRNMRTDKIRNKHGAITTK